MNSNPLRSKISGLLGRPASAPASGAPLSPPTSPFARFRSKTQAGPKPGLPSVIGNLFHGAASDTPPTGGLDIGGMMQSPPTGGGLDIASLMANGGIAGAGTPQVAPEGSNMLGGLMTGQQPQQNGLAGLLARFKAQRQAAPTPSPMMPPMPSTGGGY